MGQRPINAVSRSRTEKPACQRLPEKPHEPELDPGDLRKPHKAQHHDDRIADHRAHRRSPNVDGRDPDGGIVDDKF